MSRYWAMSKLVTLTICLILSGCGWLRQMQHQAGLATFRITEMAIDPDSGRLSMKWSKSSGTNMYRAWISRSESCSDRQTLVAVESLSHEFGRVGPGTHFGCVEAVPNYDSIFGNSCSDQYQYSDVIGKGFAADNQGKMIRAEAQRGGSWRQIADNIPYAMLLGTQGGLILQADKQILVLDYQGQVVEEARILAADQTTNHYIWSSGKLLALGSETRKSQVLEWDNARQIWNVLADFPGFSVLGFHLVQENELIFILMDLQTSTLQWRSLDPLNPAAIKVVNTISMESQLGNVFYNTASIYHDGSFIIADDRGLFRIAPEGITNLASQTGMQPLRIYHFPGAEHEVWILARSQNLRGEPANLICSYAPRYGGNWYSWNPGMQMLTNTPTTSHDGFSHAVAEGPVAMKTLVGGNFLEVFADRLLLLPAPPFQSGQLLEGPQLPDGQLLIQNGAELWLFTAEP